MLEAKNITKTYGEKNPLTIFENINLSIELGKSYAITGASGVGKTSLMHILSSLDRPTHGELFYNTIPFSQWDINQLRRTIFGFVFQNYFLLDDLTALENVLLPAKIARKRVDFQSPSYALALEYLDQVNLSHKQNAFAKTLSGGEKQRVAIARALINDPLVLFADEPTGNIDEENSQTIEKLLINLCQEKKKALVVVTHDLDFASRLDHPLKIEHKRIVSISHSS